MGKEQRPAEDLSISELETVLARKRREARQARVRRFQRTGRALAVEASTTTADSEPAGTDVADSVKSQGSKGVIQRILNRALLVLEVAAVLALVFILVSSFDVLQQLNQEVAEALGVATGTPTPIITAVVLPSGHTPPTSPGGAQPNQAEIPENLRPFVQSTGPVNIPTPGPGQARSIFIPRVWNSAAPVVQGDGWEQLKKGVGQHLDTANPGQAGNMVLSAHNDIFGELFRDLDQLQPGDEIIISSSSRDFTYRVTGMRIVEPTDVNVMEPTSKATVTLISCYPYLIDNKRIVVSAELEAG